MVTIQQAETMLNEACEALPKEIFRELNGGVNLLPDTRRDEDGSYILGLYHHDEMGRWVEIFYGSVAALYGRMPDDRFRAELVKTLHHELTHHIEGLAGDRTLERWDEEQKLLRAMGEPLCTDSVLFVDADDAALAPAVCALFERLAEPLDPPLPCASAGLAAADGMDADAVRAAAALGADIAAHTPRAVTAELLDRYDAVLCMTEAQADELAARFPARDEKIVCLGETDVRAPRLRAGWPGVMRRLKKEAEALLDELTAEEEP